MSDISRHHSSAVGAAAGRSQFSAVHLVRSRYGLLIERAGVLSMQHEGLLTAEELKEAAAGWVREHSFGGIPCCCCLPQTEVNTLITEFPQTHSRQKLTQMVDYQIRQLCGLTEEHFLSDYHVLEGEEDESIPIVLAVSRAVQVDERLAYMQGCGLSVTHLTSEGMALYNAFCALENEASGCAGRQLLLDVSPSSAVLVQVMDGRLERLSVLPLQEGARVADTVARLNEEIQNIALRSTQESGQPEDASSGVRPARLTCIWLSGGYGELSLLGEMLKRQGAFEVNILGVPASVCPRESYCGVEADGVLPALTIAYGLALQGVGASALHICILPELLVWQQAKMSIFPHMLALYVLLLLALIFQAVTFSYNIYHQRECLRQRESELDAIAGLVPQIEAAYRDLEFQQLRLMPLVELSSRAGQYLKAIDAWQQLRRLEEEDGVTSAGAVEDRWCVYLADNFAFKASSDALASLSNSGRGKASKAGVETRRRDSGEGAAGERRRSGAAGSPGLTSPEDVSGAEASKQEGASPSLLGAFGEAMEASAKQKAADEKESMPAPDALADGALVLPQRFPVRKMQHLSAMYAAGFVVQNEASYLTLKKMQEQLNQGTLFANVDDYIDFVTPGLLNKFVVPWEHFLVINRETIGRNYTTFFLKMPLMECSVDYAPEEVE